jgi:8-oxo-dGTP diphosphatase
MTPGRDFIGVGVGALVFNNEGRVFLAKRGSEARNESGCWEFPGGTVEFGEKLADAIKREMLEEYGLEIGVTGVLGAFDHILEKGKEHWVSITFLGRIIAGTPTILEPNKCSEIGWFPLSSPPNPLSEISAQNLDAYRKRSRGEFGLAYLGR